MAPGGPGWRRDGTALAEILPADEGASPAGQATVRAVRAALAAAAPRALVAGAAAGIADQLHAFYGDFPLVLAWPSSPSSCWRASAPFTFLKIFATGVGILLDATVVRSLLVPALVSLFGRWNWWLPRWAAVLLRTTPSPLPSRTRPPAMSVAVGGGPQDAGRD